MSVSVNEFWNRLVTNGIADAQRCRGWAAEYAAEHQGQPPVDAPALARQLVKQARLTPFQAEHLLRPAAPHPLRYGAWLLREGVAEAPFRGWFWADSSGPEGATAMLFPFAPPAAELEIDRRWLRSQQSIEAAGLQPIEVSEETGVVVSRLPAGERLTERLQTGEPLERSWLPRIVAAVGGGLAGLHAAGLCHGAVSAERVWLGRDGSVWLLRDASGPPSGPFRSRAGWFAPLSIPGRYAAPEFSLPGQLPDPLTDQYALGGLLWAARAGVTYVQQSSAQA